MSTSINLDSLTQALASLSRSLKVCEEQFLIKKLDPALKETLMAGAIQHFEFTFELCWKIIKRKLTLDAAVPETIDAFSYPELMREAHMKQLITHIDAWMVYRHQRNLTSHTYHLDYAQQIYEALPSFYQDACFLLNQLKQHAR